MQPSQRLRLLKSYQRKRKIYPNLNRLTSRRRNAFYSPNSRSSKNGSNKSKQPNSEEKAPFIPWDDECDLPEPKSETVSKRVDLLEQQQVPVQAEQEQEPTHHEDESAQQEQDVL